MKPNKNDTKESIYKAETDSHLENELIITRVQGCREEIVREFGIDMYTLLYFKW